MLSFRPGCRPHEPGYQRNALVVDIATFTPLPDASGIDPCPIPNVNHTLIQFKRILGIWERKQTLYLQAPVHQWEHIKLTGGMPVEEIDPPRRDGTPPVDWSPIKWAILLTLGSITLLGVYRFVELKYFNTWR